MRELNSAVLYQVRVRFLGPTFTRRVGVEIEVQPSGNDRHADLVPNLHPRRLLRVALAPIARRQTCGRNRDIRGLSQLVVPWRSVGQPG